VTVKRRKFSPETMIRPGPLIPFPLSKKIAVETSRMRKEDQTSGKKAEREPY